MGLGYDDWNSFGAITIGHCALRLLLNTPDDPHVSIARARVPPGVTTRLHRLRGIVERYVILSGTGRVEVGGQAPREVAAGDTVTIPAMHSQRIANSGQADLVFLAVLYAEVHERRL